MGLPLVLAGIVLMALGYRRAAGPYRRWRALREEDDNAARYAAWRGGVRGAATGPTGASVAMAVLRRQAQAGAAIMLVGFGLAFAGFLAGF